jgi:endonuclease/exonuclease/phosphatase family metal-dependent hydrolase
MYCVRVLYWNVDQARREEKHPETTWDVRTGRVKELIRTQNPDVIALVELRNLKTSNETVVQFCSSFPEYHTEYRYYCYNENTFCMAVLVRTSKYYISNTSVLRYTPDLLNSKIAMFVTLHPRQMDPKEPVSNPLLLGLTHLDLDEAEKMVSVKALNNYLLTIPKDLQFVVCGDFNFFADKDGAAQRAVMLENWKDIAHPLHTGLDEPSTLPGTFFGFPHDEFKYGVSTPSRLDHVFTRPTSKVTRPTATPNFSHYLFDNTSYATYTYPSDHLAIDFSLLVE